MNTDYLHFYQYTALIAVVLRILMLLPYAIVEFYLFYEGPGLLMSTYMSPSDKKSAKADPAPARRARAPLFKFFTGVFFEILTS